ncbi:TerC family protein [Paenibacillus gorillae]|uniref:TerC family protein n=1 Tax=Paenibacillus gorillae TaxID=1243662 RepID=UPI0004B77262|nr:TerC family protein [Paenibacillus gorillae]
MDSELITGLLKLILINVLLSGDNAVVIALACRNLPPQQQKKATLWGGAGAVLLRIALTFVAVWILKVPFVQVIGGILLLYIAVKLLLDDGSEDKLKPGVGLAGAVKTIIIADLVMSLDNVLAVAGAAQGNIVLIIIGLAISIPLIVWGSQLLMKIMERFPIIVWGGAALLGYTAGEMLENDKGIGPFFELPVAGGHYVVPILLAVLVVVLGRVLGKRREMHHAPEGL